MDGGEKMPLPLIERLLRAFPGAWFADAYGLTETVSGDTFLDKRMTVEKIGSVGKPCLHLEVAIRDDEDRPVPAGTLGEIVLRGPKVFKGYWKDPEATATALRGGWFHTGDVGYLAAAGFLYIVDRKKDLIISGGENIASGGGGARPLRACRRPRSLGGGSAKAASEEFQEFCRARLARFKVPRAAGFIDALPRNPSGKVLKRVLREQARAGGAG